jgi:hypothetical protein
MSDIQANVEPPGIETGGGGDDELVSVHIGLTEDDGTCRSASAGLQTGNDDAVAEALVQCLHGIAALRGPGLQLALARRMGGAW